MKRKGVVFIWFICFIMYASLISATPASEETGKAKEPAQKVKQIKVDPAVIETIESLSEKDPAIILRLYYLVAETAQAQNRLDEALNLLSQVVKGFPGQNNDILNRQMGIYQQQKNYDKVIEIARQLSKTQANNSYYLQAAANAYFSKGDIDKGIGVIQDLAGEHKNDADIQMQCAQILKSRGKQEEALKYMEAAVKIRPQDIGLMQQLGQAYKAAKKLNEAKKVYEEILSRTKDLWLQRDAQRQISEIAMQENTIDILIAQIQTSLNKEPSNINLYWRLIDVYMMQNKAAEVTKILEAAIKQFPDDKELLLMYANNCANSGRFKEAFTAFEGLAKLEPDNFYHNEQIAELYARTNKLDAAIKAYQALLSKAKDDWQKKRYDLRIAQLKQQKEQAPLPVPGIVTTGRPKKL